MFRFGNHKFAKINDGILEFWQEVKGREPVMIFSMYPEEAQHLLDLLSSGAVEHAGAGDVLRVSQSSEAVPGVVDEIEELWS